LKVFFTSVRPTTTGEGSVARASVTEADSTAAEYSSTGPGFAGPDRDLYDIAGRAVCRDLSARVSQNISREYSNGSRCASTCRPDYCHFHAAGFAFAGPVHHDVGLISW